MTKSQIWVAAFLFIFLVLFALGRLTKKEEEAPKSMGMGNNSEQSEMSSQELSGPELMSRIGCVNCHGQDLAGTNQAPSLRGVGKYWDSRENLINYLRNPMSFMDKDRFMSYKELYPNKIMPAYNNIDVKDLGKIADYIMTLK